MKAEWTSAVGISATAFIAIGVVYILIGSLGLVIVGTRGADSFSGYFSNSVDAMIFQKPVQQVAIDTPHVSIYITRLMMIFCSFMVGMGLF